MQRHLLTFPACLVLAALTGCSTVPRDSQTRATATFTASSTSKLAHALAEVETALATGLDTDAEISAYNLAVERATLAWWESHQNSPVLSGYHVTVTPPPGFTVDELVPASAIKLKRLNRRVTRAGVGAPFVAHWKYTDAVKEAEPFMTKGGYVAPLTATIDLGAARAGIRPAQLALNVSRDAETVRLNKRSHPLAADFSATGEFVLARKEGRMPKLKALLNSERYLRDMQLIALEPIDPDRVPLILVHGLMSQPATWHQLYNELQADADILRGYQIYFFRYPSGVPILFSAARFREDLTRLDQELARRGAGENRRHLLVVGHSMGGLVTKMQVQDGGEVIWKSVFGKPRDQLNLSPKDKIALERYLDFEGNPRIQRVIFAATPHRGSQLAEGTIGSIGRRLVSVPGNILGTTATALKSVAEGNDGLSQLLAQGEPDSITNLSPNSLFVRTSKHMSFRPGLTIHTISGNKKNLPLDNPKAGDSVVPYTSSHLEEAESELVVPGSGHGVHETPEGIAEIRRILLLHLEDIDR